MLVVDVCRCVQKDVLVFCRLGVDSSGRLKVDAIFASEGVLIGDVLMLVPC